MDIVEGTRGNASLISVLGRIADSLEVIAEQSAEPTRPETRRELSKQAIAIAVAVDLYDAGQRVSLRAITKRTGIQRTTLQRMPGVMRTVDALNGGPMRAPRAGMMVDGKPDGITS